MMDVSQFWLTHYPMTVRYLRRYTHDRVQAEDLAQTAFIRVLENWQAISEMSTEHAKAWILRTAYHVFIDATRRKLRESAMPEMAQPAYEEDFSGVHVVELLDSLPPNHREVVTLRHLQGYSSTEIGQMLSLPPATVRTRLRAAMVLLKQNQEINQQKGGLS